MVRKQFLQLVAAATMGGLSWLAATTAIGQVLPAVPTPDAAPAATTPPALPTLPAVSDATSDATKAASETSKSLAEPAKSTVDSAGKAATDVTKSATETTRSATAGAQEATDRARDATRDATREPVRAARDTIQDTRDQARDATREGREQLQDTRDSARDAVRDTRQDARDTARDLRDSSRDGVRGQARAEVDFRADNVRAADFGLWFNRSTANGLIIADIGPNSAITRFGFREGDRIVSVNGNRLADERQFVQYLFDPQFRNQRVEVIVFRGGQQSTIYVEPEVLVDSYTTVQVDPLEEYGLVLDDRYPNQVVVWKVLPRSPAYYAGIRPGDMIVLWSGRQVSRPRDFMTLVNQGGTGAIDIQVSRNRQLRQLQLDMGARTALRPNLDVDARGNVDVDRALPGREGRIEGRIERRDDRRDLRSDETYGAIEGAATTPLPDVQAGADVQLQPATGGVRVQTTPYRSGLLRRRGR